MQRVVTVSCVHHIAGVSTASPAIAISSDTFNCPCFVDCSSTCDTGPVLCVVTRPCGTVQQPGWCWYQHNLIPRQSPPSSWTRQHQPAPARAGQQINWMTCPRWIKIKMIFLAQHREWITFLNEMTFGNHFPGNLGLGSVLVDSLNILRYFYAWFLMAWEFLAPCLPPCVAAQ